MTLFDERNPEAIIRQATGFDATLVADTVDVAGKVLPRLTGEFWTSRQRQSHSLHGVSYRACFKAELPELFINLYTRRGETVLDPFAGRGTTVVQAALMGRRVVSNDSNPLSRIFTEPRLQPPLLSQIEERLDEYEWHRALEPETDLSMFYHSETLRQILNLRQELKNARESGEEDAVDRWIRMVATNRLSGHSSGFFSVYTLPPNQAASQKRQKKINADRQQTPEPRDVPALILKKSKQLLKDLDSDNHLLHEADNDDRLFLAAASDTAAYYQDDVRHLNSFTGGSIDLVVTSPPFLNVVQYAQDNWLRCWFNGIDAKSVEEDIFVTANLDKWREFIGQAMTALHRVMRPDGVVAFEVGEVRGGSLELEHHVAELALQAGFSVDGIIIQQQDFTKTANIWGVDNNQRGTNTQRIAVLRK
jgi:DNA modification methylase